MSPTEFDTILAVSGAGMAATSYRFTGLEAFARKSMPKSELDRARKRALDAYWRAVKLVNEFMDGNPDVSIPNLGTSLDWAMDEIHAADHHRVDLGEADFR